MDTQQFVDLANNGSFLRPLFASFGLAIFVVVVWTAVWKGLALWKAARNGDKIWFVVLLIVNTMGILEILYYFIFGKKSQEHKNPPM